MIVNQFRSWARTAAPTSRADAASALARAYLYSDLETEQRTDAVRALTALLEDSSPLVRRALADAFASAADAPHHIVLALADDHSSIAAIVLARSPVLGEAELIDCVASSDGAAQAAIASRPDLTQPIAAALAEIAAPEALVVLAQNMGPKLPEFSMRRMVERHGDHAELREALLERPDLPTCVRLDLVAATADALASFVAGCNWMSEDRLRRATREAKDRAAIVIADVDTGRGRDGARALVGHLRQARQLSVGFLLRAILSDRDELFRAALAELADLPSSRVDGLVERCESAGFAALYRKAALPINLLPAFRIALKTTRKVGWTAVRSPSLSCAAIEKMLNACTAINGGELDKLIVLLRRFEAEAARDAARETPTERAPLVLGEPRPPALRLADLDASAPRRLEPSMFVVDMAAIEAELCAA